jgi:hypothetical protein
MVFSSCIIGPGEKPLNPRLLFTVGSEFLESAESVALKGSIEFESEDHHETGSFQMILNRGDSLAFIIEGPFKVDIFRMVMIDRTAYARNRDSDQWTVVRPDEKLALPEYGIENFTPDILGYFVFPQFYSTGTLVFDSEKMFLSSEEYSFRLIPSPNNRSFTMGYAAIGLNATYSRRKDFTGGFHPSKIQVVQPDQNWKILFEIEKLKLNPRVSSKIWDRN